MPSNVNDNGMGKTQSFVILSPGMLISHYKIIEKIGAGGMGEVYLAEDTKLNRKVALKFLSPHLCQDEDCRTRFKREAQAAAVLDHPNIIAIHDVSEHQGRPYIVMQYVEGQSLQDVIKQNTLTFESIINLALQICEGLNKAYQAGIIHRDIKPSNIVMDADGRPKLLDFGLATVKGTEKLTRTGSTLGTVGYMSPEQVQGKEVDHRSDLFSFGIILYELIAGRRPFAGETEAAILNSIQNDTPEPLARYKADVPDELQRIISKLLEKDPSLRYQNAASVISDLKGLAVRRESRATIAAPKRSFRWPFMVGSVVAAVVAVVVLFSFWPKEQAGVSEGKKMLAVLPFVNLGAPEDEYFADGITDEIIGRLACIQELGVISRTSSIQYKKTDKTLPVIAKELGVEFILEGTIRWDKSGDTNRVRITPQLIKVSDDIHLWADSYERSLTQIFAVQADIATKIAEALDVTLLEPEQRDLQAKPTENLDAYQAYLRGSEYVARPDRTEENFRRATQMFERAVKLDPNFALAYAALSKNYSGLYHFWYDRTEECLTKAKTGVDRALVLSPELPEAHLALGYYYYWGYRDYDRALEALAAAEKHHPPPTRAKNLLVAYIWRRQGRFKEAIDRQKSAFELNPRDAKLTSEIAVTYTYLRRYAEVERYYDRSIFLAPDQVGSYYMKAENCCRWKGDTVRSRAILEEMPGKVGYRWFLQEMYERDYQAALDRTASMSSESWDDQYRLIPNVQLTGLVYRLMGEPELARASFDSARILLEAEVKERPDDYRLHSSLGIVYAGLGRKEEAIREGKQGMELMPILKDALIGPERVSDLAQIYVMVGEYDAALDQIDYLLSIPSELSVPLLRLDPRWDPLREHPRFKALLKKYG